MKDIFNDVMRIEDVHGVMVVSGEGSVLVSKFSPDFQNEAEALSLIDWVPFVAEMQTVKDAELVFDNARFYIKKSETGFLMVIIGENAPISMVRLNCEILLPQLSKIQPAGKRFGKLLRKKIF